VMVWGKLVVWLFFVSLDFFLYFCLCVFVCFFLRRRHPFVVGVSIKLAVPPGLVTYVLEKHKADAECLLT